MSATPFQITTDTLDVAAVIGLVDDASRSGRFGAAVTFVGAVVGERGGRRITRVEYEAYESLAVKAMQAIGREAQAQWPDARLAIVHRTGTLSPGELSVAIAAVSPEREDAFRVCRYAIERVRQIVPIWTHEYADGGERRVEGPTADPADEAVRAEALRRACA